MTKINNKARAILLCLCIALAVCGLSIGFAYIAPQPAYAQGNTKISTFTGTTSYSHIYQKNVFTKGEDYNETLYTNTGIMIYAPANTGTTYSGNTISLDSTVFTVDFTGAKVTYPITGTSLSAYKDYSYHFDILNTNGYVVWYAVHGQ